MPSIRSLPIFLLLLSALLAIFVSASPTQDNPNADPEKFQALLSSIDDSQIHEVLSQFDTRFKDGVFHHDRTAVEAVHSEDPAKATELVKLAKQKRQASNSTMTTSTAPITTSKVSETPTSAAGGSPQQTTTTTPTTTNSEIRTSVIAASSPAGASVVSSTSGAVVYSESNGALTTAHSMTAIVSYKASTTTLRITTTLPGGSVSTLTSVAVVNAAYTTLSTETAIAAESGTATGTPSLQTSRASSNNRKSGALAAVAVLTFLALAI